MSKFHHNGTANEVIIDEILMSMKLAPEPCRFVTFRWIFSFTIFHGFFDFMHLFLVGFDLCAAKTA